MFEKKLNKSLIIGLILILACLFFPVSNVSATQIGRSYSKKYLPDYGGYTWKAHSYSIAWSFLYKKQNPVKKFYQNWQKGNYKKQCGKKLSVSDCAIKAINSSISVVRSGKVYSSSKEVWRDYVEDALKKKYIVMLDEELVIYAAVVQSYGHRHTSYCFYYLNHEGKKNNRCDNAVSPYDFTSNLVGSNVKIIKKR